MEHDPENESGDYEAERDAGSSQLANDDLRTGRGAPPAALAFYVMLKRQDPFYVASRLGVMLLVLVLIALTAYFVTGRQPVGYLGITTLHDPSCSVAVSDFCASNPLRGVDVHIDGTSHGSSPDMVLTTGADGRVLVSLSPGDYRVWGDVAGDLHGITAPAPTIVADQTVEVRVYFNR